MGSPVSAQEPELRQLQVRVWTEEDGLPVNTIKAVRQTSDGYVWIGTESGLARFDGARFVTFDSPTSPLYLSAHTSRLAAGAGGDLWVGTATGLIRQSRSRTVRWDGEPSVLGDAHIAAIAADADGRTWVATAADGLFLLDGDTIGVHIPHRGVDPGSIRDIALSRTGPPWLATAEGLARVVGDTVIVHVAGEETSRDARAVLEDGRGRVWLGTRAGLFRLEGGRLVPGAESGALGGTLIRALEEDGEGRVWVATSGQGLFRLDGDRWERLGAEHGLPSDDLHALAVDDRGDLWVGTAGGVALVYAGDVLPITPTEGLSSPVVLPIIEDRNGVLWVGTFGGGVNRVDGRDVRTFGVDDGLPHDVIISLAEDGRGRIWVGTRAGLRILDGERIELAPGGALRSTGVSGILPDGRGRMWIGTNDGLIAIDGERVRRFGPAEGLANPWVISLHEAPDGSILVGTQGGGAYRIRAGRVERATSPDGPASGVVLSFHETEDGTVWIGTDAGIVRVRGDDETLLGRPHGVPDRSAARILVDDHGYFWVGTNRGVYRVSGAQLDSVADGSREAISPRLFTSRDGMPSSETNGGIHPAGWKGRSGKLYYPTMEGVAVFDPGALAAGPAPLRVVIEGVEPASEEAAVPGSTDLPPEVSDVSVHFTALDFRHGDLAEFRYRLMGYETAWASAGQRRTAYYTRVPPGRYTFEAQARLPGQPWATADPLPFRLRPYFHETTLFRAMAALLGLLGILGLHRWRVHLLRRREKELVGLVSAREAAERRYREIFENAREIVITLDDDTRIEEANREACNVLGRDRESLRGTPLAALAPADETAAEGLGRDRLDRIAAEQGLIELSLLRADGDTARVEASVRELAGDRQGGGYQLIGRDITERHLLQEQLRHSQRMEAVGQLAGGVAHDFSNILHVITGYTTLLLQGLDRSDPLREDVSEISGATERAAALTHQLLAFSRKQTLRPRVLQLNRVVRGMENMLGRLIDDDIDFVVDLDPDLGSVRADPGQMEQVITNLVVNARDAMPNGGRLVIATRNRHLTPPLSGERGNIPPGEYVVVTVTDTGSGMTDAARERIFDPFFTTKPAGRGTGLGLATVHGIVEQSGGSIRVESAIGEGSTFEVFLPTVKDTPEPEPDPGSDSRPELPVGAGHETILVVDDEEAIRKLVRRVLEKSGYRVVDAASPGDVLAGNIEAEPADIDLVLTDVVMPHMSGPELAERLVEARPELKVVFMSGYTGDKLGSRQFVHPLLRKPCSPAELIRTVREALDR